MTPLYKSLSHISHSLPSLSRPQSAINEKSGRYTLSNLPPSLDALLFSHIYVQENRNILLIFEEAREAERAFDDYAKLLGEEKLVLFSQVAQQSSIKQELRKNTAQAENFGQILELSLIHI